MITYYIIRTLAIVAIIWLSVASIVLAIKGDFSWNDVGVVIPLLLLFLAAIIVEGNQKSND